MGYATYHDMLEEAQAEAEQESLMGSVNVNMSETESVMLEAIRTGTKVVVDAEDYDQFRNWRHNHIPGSYVPTEIEIETIKAIRKGDKMVLPAKGHAPTDETIQRICDLWKEYSGAPCYFHVGGFDPLKMITADEIELVKQIREGTKIPIFRILYEELINLQNQRAAWIKKFDMDAPILTPAEIDLLSELRHGDATVIRKGDITLGDGVFMPAGEKVPYPPVDIDGLFEERLSEYQKRQIAWSLKTFGPAPRTEGIINHIKKELIEIADKPYDLTEWIDIAILALDGYWRHGGSPDMIMTIFNRKQAKNFARDWPDWRTLSEDQAIEHDRSGE